MLATIKCCAAESEVTVLKNLKGRTEDNEHPLPGSDRMAFPALGCMKVPLRLLILLTFSLPPLSMRGSSSDIAVADSLMQEDRAPKSSGVPNSRRLQEKRLLHSSA